VPVAAPEPPAPKLMTVAEDPAFSRFFTMLKVGIAMGAVKQKLAQEGYDPSLLDTPGAPSPNATALTLAADHDD